MDQKPDCRHQQRERQEPESRATHEKAKQCQQTKARPEPRQRRLFIQDFEKKAVHLKLLLNDQVAHGAQLKYSSLIASAIRRSSGRVILMLTGEPSTTEMRWPARSTSCESSVAA